MTLLERSLYKLFWSPADTSSWATASEHSSFPTSVGPTGREAMESRQSRRKSRKRRRAGKKMKGTQVRAQRRKKGTEQRKSRTATLKSWKRRTQWRRRRALRSRWVCGGWVMKAHPLPWSVSEQKQFNYVSSLWQIHQQWPLCVFRLQQLCALVWGVSVTLMSCLASHTSWSTVSVNVIANITWACLTNDHPWF